MFYTLDGSIPTTSSTPYSTPIPLSQNTTINAITAAYGYLKSAVSTGNYLFQEAAPTFSPSYGTYNTTQTVTISDAVSGGDDLLHHEWLYAHDVVHALFEPVRADDIDDHDCQGHCFGRRLFVQQCGHCNLYDCGACAHFSPSSGTYYTPETVTISDATPNVTIYYTTNGRSRRLRRRRARVLAGYDFDHHYDPGDGAGNGISQSNTSVGVYTIAANNPTFSPPRAPTRSRST